MTNQSETPRKVAELMDTVFERWWRTTVHGPDENKESLRLAFREGATVVASVLKETHQQELTAAQALAEQYKRDAERYRWLRDADSQGAKGPDAEGIIVVTDSPAKVPRYIGPLFGNRLDKAIDAAKSEQEK